MMDTTTPSYDALTRSFTRLHHLQHLQAIASWDQAANMVQQRVHRSAHLRWAHSVRIPEGTVPGRETPPVGAAC